MAGPARSADALWRLRSALAILAVVVFGILFGFVILPIAQGSASGLGPWAAFCRAVGLRSSDATLPQAAGEGATAAPISQVVWTPATLNALSHGNRSTGAIAASACFACHGVGGVAVIPQYPVLAGQSATTIYKQLQDYVSGARVNPIMSPMIQAQKFTDQQLADLSKYFANQAAATGALGSRATAVAEGTATRLVQRGDPARGIPACDACHATGVGGPIETPILTGQHHEYLAAQLRLYASAERHNDIYQRMRGLASKLSELEIDALALYYEGGSQ